MLIGIEAHSLEGERTGVGRYLFNLLAEWRKLGQKTEISNPKFILYFKNGIPADLPESGFFERKLLNTRSTAKFIHWDLPRAAAKDKVDVLFCPAYVAPLFYEGKIALTLHDIIYETHPEWFNWLSIADRILLKFVSKKVARKAAIIFTCSEFSRREVVKHYGVAAEKVKSIFLGVDASVVAGDVDNPGWIKNKYGIKNNFIFYVGSIFSRRHLPEVIKTFERLAAESGDWQLLMGGRDYTAGQSVNKLAKIANSALGRPAIVRVDFINDYDLKLLYRACAFFIWLSDYEGFGLPPLEAMAGGRPVITSNSSSLVEVAGQAAWLIKNNSDEEEIYQAMARLAEDENLRRSLSVKGKEQAAKFSWRRCAEETLEVLLKLKNQNLTI